MYLSHKKTTAQGSGFGLRQFLSDDVFEGFNALQMRRNIFEFVALLVVPFNRIIMMQLLSGFTAVQYAIFTG